MKKFFCYTVFFLSIFWICLYFDLQAFSIEGTSMFPSLNHGDICLSVNIAHSRNDIVIIDKKDRLLVKRVVGHPLDKVTITNGLLFINGVLSKEHFLLNEFTSGIVDIQLSEDEYFVLGDNRDTSNDSRTFGPVLKKDIVGRVIFSCSNPIKL